MDRGCESTRVSLDMVEMRKIPAPVGNQMLVVKSIAIHFTVV
jgi:hypothetical protein